MIDALHRKKDELTQRCQGAIILRRNRLLNNLQNFPVENAKFSCVADDSDLQEILSDAQQFGDKIKPLKYAWQKCKIIEIYEQKGSVLSSNNNLSIKFQVNNKYWILLLVVIISGRNIIDLNDRIIFLFFRRSLHR